MLLYDTLLTREEESNLIKVGVIGAVQMGAGMIAQISSILGMENTAINDINISSAEKQLSLKMHRLKIFRRGN